MDLNKFEAFFRNQYKTFETKYKCMYTEEEFGALQRMRDYSIREFNEFYRKQEEDHHAEKKRELLRKKLQNKINILKQQRVSKK